MSDLSLFETSGFSMWPFLKTGEKIIIKKVSPKDLRMGDIVLYQKNSQTICHRLVKKVEGGQGYLLYARGDSSLSIEHITEQMFLGMAVGRLKKDKFVSLNTIPQRVISKLIVIISPWFSMGLRRIKLLLRSLPYQPTRLVWGNKEKNARKS